MTHGTSGKSARLRAAVVVAVMALVAGLLSVVGVQSAAASQCDPFPDVDSSNIHCENISWLKDQDITKPKDHKYHPELPVTRGQMAAFLFRLTHPGQPSPKCVGHPFPDVDSSNIFCGYITWAAVSGVSKGYPDGEYKSDNPVTRGAMATFIYRIANPGKPVPKCTKNPYKDVAVDYVHCGSITWLKSTGITVGVGHGKYGSTLPVTRQSMATFMHRTDEKTDARNPDRNDNDTNDQPTDKTTGSISGTVTAANNKPLSGVAVTVYAIPPNNQWNATVVARVKTNSHGNYVAKKLPGNLQGYRVCFDGANTTSGPSKGGYFDQCYKSDTSQFIYETTPVQVKPGQAVKKINAKLKTATAISGTITSKATGKAIAGASVYTFPVSNGKVATANSHTVTDSHGKFRASGIPSAGLDGYYVCVNATNVPALTTYKLQCHAGATIPNWTGGEVPYGVSASDWTAAKLVTVKAGATAKIGTEKLTANRKSGVSGTVTFKGKAVANVKVTLEKVSDSSQRTGMTDSHGKYAIGSVADGQYHVCFDPTEAVGPSKTGYASECYDGVIRDYGVRLDEQYDNYQIPNSAKKITISGAGSVVTANVSLAAAAGAISGTVSDATTGAKVPGMYVLSYRLLTDGTSTPYSTTSTDTDGHYSLKTLRDGKYFVCFDAYDGIIGYPAGYSAQCYKNQPWVNKPSSSGGETPLVIPKGTGHVATANVTLKPATGITGKVTDTSGKPVSGARIDLQVVSIADQAIGGKHRTTYTLPNGTYVQSNLATGTYFVCAAIEDNNKDEGCYGADPTKEIKSWDNDWLKTHAKKVTLKRAGDVATGVNIRVSKN